MSACRSCKAAIIWARTAAGRLMPLDAQPRADGNIQLLPDGTARVLGKDDLADLDRRAALEGHVARLYVSHFATCELASAHRRRG